jgi:hypothetical protein
LNTNEGQKNNLWLASVVLVALQKYILICNELAHTAGANEFTALGAVIEQQLVNTHQTEKT